MTDFAECSMAMQDFLMILLEICLILELILLLIRITCFYGKKKIITAVTVFAVSFMLMGFLMNDHRYCQGESAYQLMLRMCPVSVLMAAMVVLLLYLCWAIWRERRRYHHSLSYWSVNEAVDDVPCGVCFSDPLGRIVLCNTKMQELSRIMTGSYLQDYEALRKVINGGSEAEGLRRLNSDSNVFYFPDDSVWMFQEYRLQEPDCAGYLQTVAVNVSEIYYNGEKIRANNEKLEILNHKLEEMYEKIGDKIREQETLAMKMQVHDNFGRSLLSIRRILERKENQDKMDEQLSALKHLVYILTDSSVENMEELCADTIRHAEELGICKNQIFVGGESAGGGLAAAVCMAARDRGTINIAYQMPLYPMLDDRDTPSSADNHGRIWNTRKNHKAWRMYLKGLGRKPGDSSVPVYAAPARQTDYSGLPPAYTFVGDGEPFYAETLDYIANLKRCGIQAEADVYHCDMHAFDMMRPEWELSCEAAQRFNEHFEYAMKNYYAKN